MKRECGMSPRGAVIWLLAAATWLVVLVPLWLRRRRRARAVVITDAQPPALPKPARPVLDEYTDDVPGLRRCLGCGPRPR